MSEANLRPTLKWSQKKNTLNIAVDARDMKGEKITIEEKRVVIDYPEGGKRFYEELPLRDEIDAEKSTYVKTGFHCEIQLVKKTEGFWKGVTENDKKIPNLKVDWDKFEDSEEEEEEDKGKQAQNPGMPQMNMEQMMKMQQMMGGMQGMGGGMPGMGGMGGMPGMGGMGGMPGMGGMGGMPGMEGLGDLRNMPGMEGLGDLKNMPDLGNLPAKDDDAEGADLDDLEGEIKEEK